MAVVPAAPKWSVPLLAGTLVLLLAGGITGVIVVGPRATSVTPPPPRPGAYRYHAVSTTTAGAAPSTTTARGTRDYVLRYDSSPSAPGEVRMRRSGEQSGYQDKTWRADGIFDLADGVPSAGETSACTWTPPKLALPLPLRVGSHRSSDSRCEFTTGAITHRTRAIERFDVRSRTTVTVAGKRLRVFVVFVQVSTSEVVAFGGETTTILRKENHTLRFSPELGVVVHDEGHAHSRSEGRGAPIEVWTDTVQDLVSAP